MKFLIVSFALAAVAFAGEYQAIYKEPLVAAARHAAILRQTSEVNPDGYFYTYETENGISAAESGALKAIGPHGEPANQVEGGYQYTGPDGKLYVVKYVAGPGGFVAQGDHFPVAPPTPEAILHSLAYNAAHPHEEGTEYYKPEPLKPHYYAQPTIVTPKPIIYAEQYTTPKPYLYQSVKPTTAYPLLLSTPVAQQHFGFPQQVFPTPTPQVYVSPVGRR